MGGLLMVNGHIHYLIIKINSGENDPDNIQDGFLLTDIGRFVNRFLTTGTVSKRK
jgi:hypothetical protein